MIVAAPRRQSSIVGGKGLGALYNRLFHPDVPYDRRYVVTFEIWEAYCDDSGSKGEPVVVVAGLLSNPERWCQFDAEWKCALDKWRIPFFHMADFESSQGDYKHWDEATHRERLNHLLGIMNKWILFGFGVGISRDSYKLAMSMHAKRQYGLYGLAGAVCFKIVKEYLETFFDHYDAEVAYLFEDGTRGYGQIERAYSLNKHRFRIATSTRMTKLHPPVQAADIFAYELFKDLQRELGLHDRRQRYPLSRLRFQERAWTYLSEPALRAISDQIDAAPPPRRKSR